MRNLFEAYIRKFLCYTVYREGHFRCRANPVLLHIASSIRGISSKHFVVPMFIVKGIFFESKLDFSPHSVFYKWRIFEISFVSLCITKGIFPREQIVC